MDVMGKNTLVNNIKTFSVLSEYDKKQNIAASQSARIPMWNPKHIILKFFKLQCWRNFDLYRRTLNSKEKSVVSFTSLYKQRHRRQLFSNQNSLSIQPATGRLDSHPLVHSQGDKLLISIIQVHQHVTVIFDRSGHLNKENVLGLGKVALQPSVSLRAPQALKGQESGEHQ